jgi:hypothetical protein
VGDNDITIRRIIAVMSVEPMNIFNVNIGDARNKKAPRRFVQILSSDIFGS